MFRTILLLCLIAFPAAAETPLACDIRIDFQTDTTGIDAPTYAKIMQKVLDTPAITEKHVDNLGKSGERTLCLAVAQEELDNVYEDLKSLIPAEIKNYKTTITAKNGKSFSSQPPKKFQRNQYFDGGL